MYLLLVTRLEFFRTSAWLRKNAFVLFVAMLHPTMSLIEFTMGLVVALDAGHFSGGFIKKILCLTTNVNQVSLNKKVFNVSHGHLIILILCQDKDCIITPKSKQLCKKCRYEKCLAIGMNPKQVLSDDERKQRFKNLLKKIEEKQRQKPQTSFSCVSKRTRRANPQTSPVAKQVSGGHQRPRKILPKYVRINLQIKYSYYSKGYFLCHDNFKFFFQRCIVSTSK